MKTVGIITTFRQPNWGSVLQAYALQKVVDSLGYSSKVIDYIYPNAFHFARGKKPFLKPLPLKSRIGQWLRLRPLTKMQLLDKFIRDEMNLTPEYPTQESLKELPKFDIWLSGSDQIWNPRTMLGDMTYFFDFVPDGSSILSYASSFSCSTLPEEVKASYAKQLSRYGKIMVREKGGAKIVEELCGKQAEVVLDPTLLLDRDSWRKLADKSRDLRLPKHYVLLYVLAYTYSPDGAMAKLVEEVRKATGWPVVVFDRMPQGVDNKDVIKCDGVGIPEFLKLVEGASVVLTSSFHGTAFSLNFGVPFLALADSKAESDDRIYTILSEMEMTDRILTPDNIEFDPVLLSPIDPEEEQSRLARLRERSIQALADGLEGK